VNPPKRLVSRLTESMPSAPVSARYFA
jgi:hypothetical protein